MAAHEGTKLPRRAVDVILRPARGSITRDDERVGPLVLKSALGVEHVVEGLLNFRRRECDEKNTKLQNEC